jgi:hypothetical protein
LYKDAFPIIPLTAQYAWSTAAYHIKADDTTKKMKILSSQFYDTFEPYFQKETKVYKLHLLLVSVAQV